MRKPLYDRFYAKVRKTDNCWEWTAYTLYNGYGRFSYMSQTHYAHRVSWLIEHGDWPNGNLMHICDNPLCVRPSHLKVASQTDNIKDRNKKHRQYSGSKTHCRHGVKFIRNENGRRAAVGCPPCDIQRDYARRSAPAIKQKRAERRKKNIAKKTQSRS